MAWARERGAAAHLDGARLWEASAGYGRSPAEIAGLFDTTYVSFYKGIGALRRLLPGRPGGRRRRGARVAAPAWAARCSACGPARPRRSTCLRRRLPLMPAYLQRAREIADAVRDLPGVTVVPDPPQTPMLHLLLRTDPDAFAAAVRTLAEGGLWTWERAMPTGDPGVVRVELSVGDATMALPVAEIRAAIAALAGSTG